MSVYSFFTRLRKQVSFLQDDSNTEEGSNSVATLSSASQNEDTEDDGYLLIDSTNNVNVVTSIQVSRDLPLDMNVVNDDYTSVSDPTMFYRAELLPQMSEDLTSTQNQRSPLSDIPFKLHPALNAQLQANAIFHDINLEHHSFDWSKYSHDFIDEKLCLRDMNSDEMANIDEFILTSAGSQTYNKLPSRNSEVNLMQF